MLKRDLHKALVTITEAAYAFRDNEHDNIYDIDKVVEKVVKLLEIAGTMSSRKFSQRLLKRLTKLERIRNG